MASQPNTKIAAAVVRTDAEQKQRLLDRAFALAFKGLVYAQIWEDPVVDMAALDIGPDDVRHANGPVAAVLLQVDPQEAGARVIQVGIVPATDV